MPRLRIVALVVSLFAVCLAGPSQAYQVMNLIYNGSFEQRTASSGMPSGWRFYTTEGSTYTWGYSPCTGGRDIYVNRTSTAGCTLVDNWDHRVPVTGGMNYKYKFSAKGSGTLHVYACWMKPDGTSSSNEYYYTLTAGYTQYTIDVSAPIGYSTSWFQFQLTGAGTFDIDDITMIADPGAQQFPDAFINLSWANWGSSSLAQIYPADGNTTHQVLWDKECRMTNNNATGHYIYLNVDDLYMYANGAGYKVAITVEYADTDTGSFSLQYDGVSGAFTSAGVVTKTGTQEWKKKTFYISDAYFGNREGPGGDFRIDDQGDGGEYISYVAVAYWNSTTRSYAKIKDNHLEVNGSPYFLKMGSFGADFSWEDLVTSGYAAQLAAKGYNSVLMDHYWGLWDDDGSGSYKTLTNMTNFINDCSTRGIKCGMAFETGNVGGVATPSYLFDWYTCQARNSSGALAIDTEYGTNARIESISSEAFLNRSRNFMHWLLTNTDKTKITWYETAVEPQYIGNQWLDYSDAAYEKWRYWLSWRFSLSYLNSQWSTSYTSYDQISMPTSSSDRKWGLWMRWRAYALAAWINGDTQTIKNKVGEEALVAVDALIVTNMDQRMGDYGRVMNQINPNVFQVNWHWASRAAYNAGYDTVVPIARTKNQAISEHMTLTTDVLSADVDACLRHTLTKGNKFGWYCVLFRPDTASTAALYDSSWFAKPTINVLDTNNAFYMNLASTYLTLPL